MEIKPIRTDEDYEAAMARIEELWGIPPDSPDADELEIFLGLTGVYEKKRYHIPAPDPSVMLEYRMDQMGLSPEEKRRYVECRKRLPEILSRETEISLEIIKDLEEPPLERSETA